MRHAARGLAGKLLITALAIVFLFPIFATQAMAGNENSPVPLVSKDVSGDMPAITSASIDGLSIPSMDALLIEVKQKTRPRSVDVQALQAKHGLAPDTFAGVLHRIEGWHQETLPVEPALPLSQLPKGEERVAQLRAIQQQVFDEEEKILPAALVWLTTGNGKVLIEAKRRALNLASWNSSGATSFKVHDQAGRSVAWTLALAYDWLYPEFSEAERARLVAAISDRLGEMLGKGPYGLDDGRKLNANPYNSHGAVALARVSAICAVMAGVSPQFDACFRNTVPRYLMWPVPWGRDDGGYANGTNYGHWDTAYTHLVVWDLLRESIGVDLTATPWARGYGKFITYFLPPGTPTGLFGDGAEKNWRDVWATQAKAYAARVPSPLTDWYARQQFGEDATKLYFLLAPYRDWSKTPPHIPADTPNAIHLPSVGWVAMHSNLADRGRNSVYFKSSPYGSFNHSHADQNSFVINSRGQPLAIDSGYYDYYNSPHWKGWYKQTKAHNAMTFDGGVGQLHDTMAAKGSITAFQHGTDVDVVRGDATAAYGSALKRAVRTLVYLRPGTLLVYDSLVSGEPRTWEWNVHALKKMSTDGSTSFALEEGGERLCGKVLDGPEMIFIQTNRFPVDPKGDEPKQWHGTFSTSAKQPSLNMLVMLTVGCVPASVVVTKSGTDLHVTVDKYNVTFSGEGQVELQ